MIRVPPYGPRPADIAIVGEAPGLEEERHGMPFVGASGQELDRMLHEAGIIRTDCYITNVVKFRPPDNDIGKFYLDKSKKKPGPLLLDGKAELLRELKEVKPKIVIALGNTPLWALCNQTAITKWRGSILQGDGYIVIPTYHPAAILRQWDWRAIAVHDLRKVTKVINGTISPPSYRFTVRPSFAAVMGAISNARQRCDAITANVPRRTDPPPNADSKPLLSRFRIAVDIETRGGHTACIGLAFSKIEAICIPLMCTERPEGYWSLEEEHAIIVALRELLLHPAVEVVGQNFIYDVQYFAKEFGFAPIPTHDTMLMQHVFLPGLKKGLDFLSSMYCEWHEYWKDEGKEWDKNMPEERLWIYNCKDAVITYEVCDVLLDQINRFNLQEVYRFQMSLFKPVLRMMLRGVRIDMQARAAMAKLLGAEISKQESFINTVVGREFNVNSPKQMQELFYNELGQKIIKKRTTGKPTCDEEAIEKMAIREPLLRPLVKAMTTIRSAKVFKSTFVDAELDNERIRCSFNIGGAESYRFSSSSDAFGSGTNLQNVPRNQEE